MYSFKSKVRYSEIDRDGKLSLAKTHMMRQKEYAEKYFSETLSNAHKTAYQGFEPDVQSWSAKLGQMTSAASEYSDTLHAGVLGSAKYLNSYNNMITKLNAASLEEFTEDINNQAKEYKAAQ